MRRAPSACGQLRERANCIPHYTKKKQILAREELTLRRLIDRGAAPQKVMAAMCATLVFVFSGRSVQG
jgi:hypothetical protein